MKPLWVDGVKGSKTIEGQKLAEQMLADSWWHLKNVTNWPLGVLGPGLIIVPPWSLTGSPGLVSGPRFFPDFGNFRTDRNIEGGKSVTPATQGGIC